MDLAVKQDAFAHLVEGKVVDEHERVEVCIKGSVLGFKATIEATKAGFPFGTNFFIETNVTGGDKFADPSFAITIVPKMAKGVLGFFTRLLLLDSHESPIGMRAFDDVLLAQGSDQGIMHRFLYYPGLADKIIALHNCSGFSEFHIQGGQGLVLNCPTNFNAYNFDSARETLALLGPIAQTLFESF